jgi:hypothetical protein
LSSKARRRRKRRDRYRRCARTPHRPLRARFSIIYNVDQFNW